MNNSSILRIIENDRIPSPPAVAARILDLVSQPDNDMRLITKVVGSDPKLAARLIDYCNSPLLGSKRTVNTLQQAVMVLGLRSLRLLSLSFSLMETESDAEFDYEDFWRSSLATAIAAKASASHRGANEEELFLLGLMLNVGRIGICLTYPELVAAEQGKHGQSFAQDVLDAETQLVGSSRFEVGACLLEKWNFPPHMVETLRHFDPRQLTEQTKLLYVGRLIAELLLQAAPEEQGVNHVKEQVQLLLEIDNEAYCNLFNRVINEWKGYQALFSFEAIEFESIKDLERRAKESMIQISLNMDTEIRQMVEEKRNLEEAALFDPLTTLKNRAAYLRECPGSLGYLQSRRVAYGLIVIDIDHFKKVNDTYGHVIGDQVLREVGKCLSLHCRAYDNIYRYGGEEFVALIVDADHEKICRIAERFRSNVSGLHIRIGTDKHIHVTISLGVCWIDAGDSVESLDDVFQRADKNLYQAKRAGRDQVVCTRLQPDPSILGPLAASLN
ncbi:MAG: GGDEF domain-containing protein [bacterium]|nr:GGDEF domain-containing protein [bacterium]